MSGLVCTCSLDGRWSCVSNYFRWLNKTDITLVHKQYSRKRIRCGFNNPLRFLQLQRQTAWAWRPGLMPPTLGTEELHHSWAHTAHPGQRGAAPTAGLTPPTLGRGERCPQLGSHCRRSLLQPAPALTLDRASAGRGKAALNPPSTLDQKKLLFTLALSHIPSMSFYS